MGLRRPGTRHCKATQALVLSLPAYLPCCWAASAMEGTVELPTPSELSILQLQPRKRESDQMCSLVQLQETPGERFSGPA